MRRTTILLAVVGVSLALLASPVAAAGDATTEGHPNMPIFGDKSATVFSQDATTDGHPNMPIFGDKSVTVFDQDATTDGHPNMPIFEK